MHRMGHATSDRDREIADSMDKWIAKGIRPPKARKPGKPKKRG
ncbi:hypothetical protein [Actinoplanes sp. GCM10030250]